MYLHTCWIAGSFGSGEAASAAPDALGITGNIALAPSCCRPICRAYCCPGRNKASLAPPSPRPCVACAVGFRSEPNPFIWVPPLNKAALYDGGALFSSLWPLVPALNRHNTQAGKRGAVLIKSVTQSCMEKTHLGHPMGRRRLDDAGLPGMKMAIYIHTYIAMCVHTHRSCMYVCSRVFLARR